MWRSPACPVMWPSPGVLGQVGDSQCLDSGCSVDLPSGRRDTERGRQLKKYPPPANTMANLYLLFLTSLYFIFTIQLNKTKIQNRSSLFTYPASILLLPETAPDLYLMTLPDLVSAHSIWVGPQDGSTGPVTHAGPSRSVSPWPLSRVLVLAHVPSWCGRSE